MEILNKYEDARSALMLMMTDPVQAIANVHALALAAGERIDAIDAATKNAGKSADKVNVLDAKYGKDEEGAKAAIDFLRTDGGIFDQITEYLHDDERLTYHMRAAIVDYLVKYLNTEVSYFTVKGTPKVAKVSDKSDLKQDFGEYRDLIAHIAGIKSITPDKCDLVTVDKSGKVKSIIAGRKGPRKGNTEGVTGRYAKIYNLAWIIDGNEIAEGWTIPVLVRMIWTGADRIGKNAKNLTEILDAKTTWTRPDFTTKNFTVNGHKITVTRITDNDDDDTDDESESDESESE